MKKLPSLACIAAVAAAALCGTTAQAQGRPDLVAASLNTPGVRYAAGELLVQFRRGHTAEAQQAVLARVGAARIQDVRLAAQRRDGRGDLLRVRLPAGADLVKVMQRLQADASVDFTEPNWKYQHTALQADPYYADGRLWGMYGDSSRLQTNAFGSGAAEAWDTGGNRCSRGVYVGVIDEGTMPTHEDLVKNIWTNPFDPVDGVDNDGNGFVDDVHGWDFFSNDNSNFDGVGDDHGTHVAGTIGATGGNGKGVVGVCPKVTIINAKFLGPAGGSTADAIRSVAYMIDLKTRHGLNIVALSNSWGGGGFSQALGDAIEAAGEADMLFVAAAGNGNFIGVGQNNDNKPHYPSSYAYDNVIAVAALTSAGRLASFSNYGRTSVDLAAPGVGVYSTVPTSSGGSGYASYDGTSMATPHVSGAVAMYASTHPGATALQIKAAILAAAIPTASLTDKCVTGGRLDVSGF